MSINPICPVSGLLSDDGKLLVVGSTRNTTNVVYNANYEPNQIKQDYAKRYGVPYTEVRLMGIKNYRKRQPKWLA